MKYLHLLILILFVSTGMSCAVFKPEKPFKIGNDPEETVNGFLGYNGFLGWDDEAGIIRIAMDPNAKQNEDILRLGVKYLFDVGVGLFGARAQVLPFSAGLGAIGYSPEDGFPSLEELEGFDFGKLEDDLRGILPKDNK